MSRETHIEVFMPTEGLHYEAPSSMITPRSTPYVRDANAYFGAVQKDYGTTLFSTGTDIGAPCNLIYQADFPANSTLLAFSHTGMFKYSSGSDAFVADGQVYTGTFTDFWGIDVHNADVIFTNGVDLVQRKAAYNSTGTVLAGVTASSYKAFGVRSFADHLNLYHTIESGVECPKRIRWAKVGLLAYATSDWLTGYAGFLDLQDMEGSLMCQERLGPLIAVYGENSIHVQEWVGGDSVYKFTKMVSGRGTPSRRGVVRNDTIHYVLCFDGIYEYYGGREITEISEAIRPRYVSTVNRNALQYAWLQYIQEENELRAHVPTGTSTQPDTCFVCRIGDGYKWYEQKRAYTCAGEFNRASALTIGELVGNIGAQNWKFGDQKVAAGSKQYLMSDSTGRLVKMDKTVYSLSYSGTSTAQSFVFDTKDFTTIRDIDPLIRDKYNLSMYMDHAPRWTMFAAEFKGNGTVTIEYSIDGGNSFTKFPASPLTIAAEWDFYMMDVDVSSPEFRVRISNNNTNEVVHMRYARVSFIPGSDVQ